MAPAPPLSSRPLCCGRGHRLCQAGHGHCPGHWPTACAGGGDGRGQGPWCCPQVSASCPMLARSRWPQTHALLGASGQAPCGVGGGRKVLAQRQQVLGKQSWGPALRGSEPLLLSDQAAGGTPPPPPGRSQPTRDHKGEAQNGDRHLGRSVPRRGVGFLLGRLWAEDPSGLRRADGRGQRPGGLWRGG